MDRPFLEPDREGSSSVPSSAPCASPVSSEITQLCSGQVTQPSWTMPWLQRTALVRAAVLEGEDAVIGGAEHGDARPPCLTQRAPRRGMSASEADRDPVRDRRSFRRLRASSAIGLNSCGRPCRSTRSDQGSTLGESLAEDEAVEIGAALVGVLDDRRRLIESMPTRFGPFVDAFEIVALLAVKLDQRDDASRSPRPRSAPAQSTSVPLMSRPAAPAKWIS